MLPPWLILLVVLIYGGAVVVVSGAWAIVAAVLARFTDLRPAVLVVLSGVIVGVAVTLAIVGLG